MKIELVELHNKIMRTANDFEVPETLSDNPLRNYLRGYEDALECIIKYINECIEESRNNED